MTFQERKTARLAKLTSNNSSTQLDRLSTRKNAILDQLDNALLLNQLPIDLTKFTNEELTKIALFIPSDFDDVYEIIKKTDNVNDKQLNDSSIEAKFLTTVTSFGTKNDTISISIKSNNNYQSSIGPSQDTTNSYTLSIPITLTQASIANITAFNNRFKSQFNQNNYGWKCTIDVNNNIVLTAPDNSGTHFNDPGNYPIITKIGSVDFAPIQQIQIATNPEYSVLIWNPTDADKLELKTALESDLGSAVKIFPRKRLILI